MVSTDEEVLEVVLMEVKRRDGEIFVHAFGQGPDGKTEWMIVRNIY